MPPRPREFAVLCVLLVALHAGAAGTLWAQGGAVATPGPATADPDDGPETLLLAAARNDAAVSMTSEVTLRHPDNGSTVTRISVAADTRRGRIRLRTPVRRVDVLVAADELYVTPWGEWERAGTDWQYSGGPDAGYDPRDPRLFVPIPASADRIRATTNADGTTTVRLEGARSSLGVLSVAGDDATLTYRIAVDDGRPYVVAATARPTDPDGLAATVDRRRGADVRRPEALPPAAPGEVRDRLLAGATLG